MRLRSGVVTNDQDDSTRVGEMSAEETAAEVAALRNELTRLTAEVAAKSAQPEPGSSSCSRGRPTVQVAEPVDNVVNITEFSGIVHQRTNPVQRPAVAPDTCSLLDLECESGHIRASKAGPAVVKEYDETVAPALSYLYDAQQALDQLIRAADIPEARRKSLAVIAAAQKAVLDFLTERHDLLVAKGEFKHDPSLLHALEQGLAGVEGLPIQSSGRVQQHLEKLASARVLPLTKQSAKQSGGSSRGGTGSNNPPA